MRGALLVLGSLLLGAVPVAAQQTVVRLDVHGVIENGLAPYLERGLREAKARGAAAVILDLDTPGGRVDAAQRIVDALRASPVPVIAHVNPRAFSAGAMIALAADSIVMAPTGVIGAATPVDGSGSKSPEKIVSAMRAEFRALAEARGLDPRVAEAMVDESIAIPGVVEEGKLLTLSANEAERVGVAQAIAANESQALDAAGFAGATVVPVPVSWAEQVARFLTHPAVAPLLLSIGMVGLIWEIKAGAFGLGFVLSLAALGAYFGASAIAGLAGWEEAIVFAAGLAALGIEAFVLPGFGIAGIAGIGLLGTSAMMAMVGASPTGSDLLQAVGVMAAAVVLTLAVGFVWLRRLPTSPRFSGLMLKDGLDREQGFVSAPTRDELVGREGEAATDLRPSGVATVDGERLDVVTEGEFVAVGSPVVIIRSDGYRHVVRGR